MTGALWIPFFTSAVVFVYFLLVTALVIWGERRVVAKMQSRVGPNRIGPLGALQTLVDGAKLFFKEDLTPAMVTRPIYTVAPIIGVVAGFLSVAVIPIGGEVTLFGETFTLQAADLSVGALWILAMGSIHVYSVFLAGWSSNSAYPLLGGVRSTAQMVSYEIAQGLSIASVFIYTGSLRISDIVAAQESSPLIDGMPGWYVIPLFPAFLVFAVGMVAEAGRPPFDLSEAEGELVGGFNTEYSGMRFAMFMLAEFLSVVTMSAIVVTLFFGGPNGPTFGLPDGIAWIMPILWFTLKTAGFIFFFILLRGALPRARYDSLMNLGWKVLIPVALVWVVITAVFVLRQDDMRLVFAGIATVIIAGLLVTANADRSPGEALATPAPLPPDPSEPSPTESEPASSDREEVTT